MRVQCSRHVMSYDAFDLGHSFHALQRKILSAHCICHAVCWQGSAWAVLCLFNWKGRTAMYQYEASDLAMYASEV